MFSRTSSTSFFNKSELTVHFIKKSESTLSLQSQQSGEGEATHGDLMEALKDILINCLSVLTVYFQHILLNYVFHHKYIFIRFVIS